MKRTSNKHDKPKSRRPVSKAYTAFVKSGLNPVGSGKTKRTFVVTIPESTPWTVTDLGYKKVRISFADPAGAVTWNITLDEALDRARKTIEVNNDPDPI